MGISLHKHQSGVAHLVIILVVVVLAVVGGAGYVVLSKNKDKISDASTKLIDTAASKQLNSACIKEIDDKDFCRFASNWSLATNYTTVITTKGADGTNVMKLETESSDKTSMTTTTDGKETAAYITIGKTSYTKDYTDNKWTKYTSTDTDSSADTDVKSEIKIDDFTDSDTSTVAKTEYKKIGKEACGNLTCFKYQIIDPDDQMNTQFIWFDDEDYLLRKYTGNTIDETFEMVLSYTKVTVKEPSPVKEAPNYEGMSPEELQTQFEGAQADYETLPAEQ
jgi:hypothetical protein